MIYCPLIVQKIYSDLKKCYIMCLIEVLLSNVLNEKNESWTAFFMIYWDIKFKKMSENWGKYR